MAGSAVFCSTGLVHPSLLAGLKAFAAVRTAAAHAWSGRRRRPVVRLRYGLGGLRRALRSDCRLVIVYIHRRRDAQDIVDLAERYVARGGHILALHAATASFRGSERWSRLLGGRFAGHGPVGERVLQRDPDPGVRQVELPERITVRDEAYRHEHTGPIDVWYRWDDGEPAAWTVGGGSANVAYFAPGHRARVWTHPSVRVVLAAMIATLGDPGGV